MYKRQAYAYAVSCLDGYARLQEELAAAGQTSRKILYLGATNSIAVYQLPACLLYTSIFTKDKGDQDTNKLFVRLFLTSIVSVLVSVVFAFVGVYSIFQF